MPDGTVLCVELQRRTVDRVHPDGTVEVIAEPGGSPNGLAIGPDGAGYVCNSGGWDFHELFGMTITEHAPARRLLGRPHRARRPRDGRRDRPLHRVRRQPAHGSERSRVRRRRRHVVHRPRQDPRRANATTVASTTRRPTARRSREVIYPLESPNGIGLSPEGDRAVRRRDAHRARLLVAGRGPGRGREAEPARPRRSAARRAARACSCSTRSRSTRPATSWSATLVERRAHRHPARGRAGRARRRSPDPLVTNVCFGGDDLSTAFVTCSGTGKLVSLPWPRPGLELAF